MQDINSELVGIKVAGLELWLDARESGFTIVQPPNYSRFMATGPPDGGLILPVHNDQLPPKDGWRSLYYPSKTWELWQDERGFLVFIAPEVCPPKRQAAVASDFSCGEVIGEFGSRENLSSIPYPLENIEIMLFANWLANSGDLILHAAGLSINGKGVCFAGSSGAGKSTLIRSLKTDDSITILGEDQVVLRFEEGRFWIYGTPWHLDPAKCSPLGVPLEKLYFLERGKETRRARILPIQGITRLLQTAFIPYYRPETVAVILERLALLAEQVPFFSFSYLLGSDMMDIIVEN